MRRGFISFDNGQFRFRFARQGFDVDTATAAQMAIDERVFYGQLYMAGFAANNQPNVSHSVVVNFPSLGFVPLCICFTRYAGKIIYPAHDKYLVGNGTFYYPSIVYVPAATSLTLAFGEQSGVEGIYYLVFRRRA
ncbi:hypothetical protein [Ensifer canadensis]